jgi:hypothetical protein
LRREPAGVAPKRAIRTTFTAIGTTRAQPLAQAAARAVSLAVGISRMPESGKSDLALLAAALNRHNATPADVVAIQIRVVGQEPINRPDQRRSVHDHANRNSHPRSWLAAHDGGISV